MSCGGVRQCETISLPWVRRGFKTNIVHTVREGGFMEYEQIRQSAKMRLCRALSSVVFALLRDGIEKVRGSTPLTSTTPNVRVEQWLPCSSTARFRSAATNAKAVPSTPCFARLNASLASRCHCTKTYLPHPKQRQSTGARSKQLSVSRIVRNVV